MIPRGLITFTFFSCLILLSKTPYVLAETFLIIDDDTNMTIGIDHTVVLSCNDIILSNNGTLILNGGTLINRGKVISSNGGKFIKISGIDDKCYKSYYVIPGPNGAATIISL